MKIPLTKTVTMQVNHGELEIKTVKDNSYEVYYHNNIYQNSPFKMTQSFSTEFSIQEIVNSNEVINFITSITGETHNRH